MNRTVMQNGQAVKLQPMSINEVIAELPRLKFEERQILIRRALELDDAPCQRLFKRWLKIGWLSITPIQVLQCC